MTRPIYETRADAAFEDFFCKEVVPEYRFKKLPRHYGFDFMGASTDGRTLIAELKHRRNYHIENLPDGKLILSLQKYYMFKSYAELGFDTKLYVAGKDGVFVVNALNCEKHTPTFSTDSVPVISFAGRKDRNDPADIEPCVYYPIKNFSKLLSITDLEKLNGHREIQILYETADRIRGNGAGV